MGIVTGVRLAQEFGWTLEYCESLDPFVKADIFGVLDGQQKVEQERIDKAKRKKR